MTTDDLDEIASKAEEYLSIYAGGWGPSILERENYVNSKIILNLVNEVRRLREALSLKDDK